MLLKRVFLQSSFALNMCTRVLLGNRNQTLKGSQSVHLNLPVTTAPNFSLVCSFQRLSTTSYLMGDGKSDLANTTEGEGEEMTLEDDKSDGKGNELSDKHRKVAPEKLRLKKIPVETSMRYLQSQGKST